MLAAFTCNGAYAGHMEDRTGTLRPGMLADLVLLSGDIEATHPTRSQHSASGLQFATDGSPTKPEIDMFDMTTLGAAERLGPPKLCKACVIRADIGPALEFATNPA